MRTPHPLPPCSVCGNTVKDRRSRYCSNQCQWAARRGSSPEAFAAWFASMLVARGDCLEWSGGHDRKGYGRLQFEGRQEQAHRAAWVLAGRPLPPGLLIRHSCDNPPCARIEHLSLGTTIDNANDRWERGRTSLSGRPGAANSSAKLTDDQVREIRRRAASGETHRSLAPLFGLSHQSIGKIARRQRWSSLAD